jgi:hypothetical protein
VYILTVWSTNHQYLSFIWLCPPIPTQLTMFKFIQILLAVCVVLDNIDELGSKRSKTLEFVDSDHTLPIVWTTETSSPSIPWQMKGDRDFLGIDSS